MKVIPDARWERVLALIRENVSTQQFTTWFSRIVFIAFGEAERVVYIAVPSHYVYEYLEENYVDLLSRVLHSVFGEGVKLKYRVLVDKEHGRTQVVEGDESSSPIKEPVQPHGAPAPAPEPHAPAADLDPRLNPRQTFDNYIEGTSNKLPRSVGRSIAEHPNNSKFNPMFIYGPSGCGKTHLINAIGVATKSIYPQKRVLYISARLFQVQYTDAVRQNTVNDFIRFYQTIDMLILDDVQEWVSSPKTQDTFFHIFNHLFKNGKRIILASDRPPVDLKGMNDRLLTRFSCGLIAELEKPNVQLCVDILRSKIRRDGLSIPDDVIEFIAQTANGSVRDLEGVINSLMAYSVVYNCNVDMRLADRVIRRAVKIDDKPLTVDDIMDKVCTHFNVTQAAVNSKSRKRDYVVPRQLTMYFTAKYTKMPAGRIGKLIGGRDHSTVIHSCSQIEKRLKVDKMFAEEVVSIENSFKLKK